MASVAIETTIGSSRKLPDFPFPPKYASSSNPAPAPKPISKSPPSFGFPLYTIPRPTPTSLPEITSPLTPLSLTKPTTPSTSKFLTIPLEIRLQIYAHVLATHPIHHAHLAPLTPPTTFSGMNTEEFHTTMLRHSSSSLPSSSPVSDADTAPTHRTTRTLITKLAPSSEEEQKINALYPISSPGLAVRGGNERARVQGKIPTALLLCCRQVFEESRFVPWERNTFTFINWFWSGVYASRQFTRSLRPWQSEAMRWVGVEVLARDLKVDAMGKLGGGVGNEGSGLEKGMGEWWELCELWKGVWGVRLGVKGGVGEKREVDGSAGWNGELGDVNTIQEFKGGEGILDVRKEWVVDGLLKMRNLRWIELEIEDEDVDREVKLQFCAELEEAFNSHSTSQQDEGNDEGKRNVKVIFVERVKVEEKLVSNKDFVWYGGTAGDDSIWGLDIVDRALCKVLDVLSLVWPEMGFVSEFVRR